MKEGELVCMMLVYFGICVVCVYILGEVCSLFDWGIWLVVFVVVMFSVFGVIGVD